MSSTNSILMSEEWAVVGTIDPDANGTGAITSDVVDMSKYDAICAIVMAGTLGTSATLDAKLQASTATGTGMADITGKAITQLVKATDDDKQAIINLSETEVDPGDRYVQLVMTVGTATSDCGAVILGRAKHRPANANDLASVAEIVS